MRGLNAGTVAQALATARQEHRLDALDAELLLLQALGRADSDRAWLRAHDADALPPTQVEIFINQCERRAAGEPLAYLVGHKEFFGLSLAVDPRVLIPRPDTETLVAWALDLLPRPEARVLDLGTGSGAIALALKHERPAISMHAVDASAGALAVAQANAERLGLDITFVLSDWLAQIQGRFDLIVSNPPYIALGDSHLPALSHEPDSALTSGTDGLDAIRRIVRESQRHLQPGAWLVLEHGYDQASAVRQVLTAAGFGQVQSRRDLAGIERCSAAQWPSAGLGLKTAR